MNTEKNTLLKSVVDFIYHKDNKQEKNINLQGKILQTFLEQEFYEYNHDLVKEGLTTQFLFDSELSVDRGFCQTIKRKEFNKTQEFKATIAEFDSKVKEGKVFTKYNLNKFISEIESGNYPTFENEEFCFALKLYSNMDTYTLKNKEAKISTPVKILCALNRAKIEINKQWLKDPENEQVKEKIQKIRSIERNLTPIIFSMFNLKTTKTKDVHNLVNQILCSTMQDQAPIQSYFRSLRFYKELQTNSSNENNIKTIDDLYRINAHGYIVKIFNQEKMKDFDANYKHQNIFELIANTKVNQNSSIDAENATKLHYSLQKIQNKVVQFAPNATDEQAKYLEYLTYAIISSKVGQKDYHNTIGVAICDPLAESLHNITHQADKDALAEKAIEIVENIAKEEGVQIDLSDLKNSLAKAESKRIESQNIIDNQNEGQDNNNNQNEEQQDKKEGVENKGDNKKQETNKKSKKSKKETKTVKTSPKNKGIKELQNLIDSSLENIVDSIQIYQEQQSDLEKLDKENEKLTTIQNNHNKSSENIVTLKNSITNLNKKLNSQKGQLIKQRNAILRDFFDDKFIKEAQHNIAKISKSSKLTKSQQEFKANLDELQKINNEIKALKQEMKKSNNVEALNVASGQRKINLVKSEIKTIKQDIATTQTKLDENLTNIRNAQIDLMNANYSNIANLKNRLEICNQNIKELNNNVNDLINKNPILNINSAKNCDILMEKLSKEVSEIKKQIKNAPSKQEKEKLAIKQNQLNNQLSICTTQRLNFTQIEKYEEIKTNLTDEIEKYSKLDEYSIKENLAKLEKENKELSERKVSLQNQLEEKNQELEDAKNYALDDTTPAKLYTSINSPENYEQKLEELRTKRNELIEKIEKTFENEQIRILLKEVNNGKFDKYFNLMEEFDQTYYLLTNAQQKLNEEEKNIQIIDKQLTEQSSIVENLKEKLKSSIDITLAEKHGLWLNEKNIKDCDKVVNEYNEKLANETIVLNELIKERDTKVKEFIDKYGFMLKDDDVANRFYNSGKFKDVEELNQKVNAQKEKVNEIQEQYNNAVSKKQHFETRKKQILQNIQRDKKLFSSKIDSVNISILQNENKQQIDMLDKAKTYYLSMKYDLEKLAEAISKNDKNIASVIAKKYTLDSNKYSNKYSRLDIYNAIMNIAQENFNEEIIEEVYNQTKQTNVLKGFIEILKNPNRYVISKNLQEILDNESMQKLVPMIKAAKKSEINKKARDKQLKAQQNSVQHEFNERD